MKRKFIFDIEIYKNLCIIGGKWLDDGSIDAVMWKHGSLSAPDRKWLRSLVEKHCFIGFNSINFDMLLLFAAIAGMPVKVLKDIANDIIVGKMRRWDVERKYKFKVPKNLDHIDLIEIPKGQLSLKLYNGRLHGRRMQDLPYDPDEVLTDDECEEVWSYWENDLDATELLHKTLIPQIDLRTKMSKEYDIDLRSKSDAQVAEAVIKSEVSDLLGRDVKRPDITPGTGYPYNIPDFIRFKDDGLNDLLDEIEETKFRIGNNGKMIVPPRLGKLKIRIGKAVYTFGNGGLHSTEKSTCHIAGKNHKLADHDVESYYPRIIINQNLRPEQMGAAFQKVYRRIVDRRLKAKSEANLAKAEIEELKESLKGSNSNGGPSLMEDRIAELLAIAEEATVTADSLKITINGSFGKFGSKWSALYAPQLLIQTTITGQLSLLMLIHRLERNGIEVVSANTDGIVVKCHRDDEDLKARIIKKWEQDTGYKTDATEYAALYSRDINNYIALKPNGSAKRKGAFGPTSIDKNPTSEICSDAVVEFLTKGTPFHKTIRKCRDVTKFVTVRTVKGGALDQHGNYLGKAIRWVYSTEVEGAIHYKTPNATGNHNKVPRSEGARPLMELPDKFPDDLDYQFYVREARSILCDIGYQEALY